MDLIPVEVKKIHREGSTSGSRTFLEHVLDSAEFRNNPNFLDKFGKDLLFLAILDHDNDDPVERLIKAGVDIDAKYYEKQTPLHLAVLAYNCKRLDLLNYHALIEKFTGQTFPSYVVDDARSCIVKKLLVNGADPNVGDDDGDTPLMIAAEFGDLDHVKDLLAFGADVHFRNKYLKTCLHRTSWLCVKESIFDPIFIELLKHGACVNCCDDIGNTALDVLLEVAEITNRWQLVKTLIKTSILVNWKYKIIFQVKRQNQKKLLRLGKFMDGCRAEVSRMSSYVYSDESTLCQIVLNGGKMNKNGKYDTSILDEVLDTLIKDEFPFYDDFIEAHFNKTFLKEKLFEKNICVSHRNVKIRLDPYLISDVASYLSVRDILNLLKAFVKPPTVHEEILNV